MLKSKWLVIIRQAIRSLLGRKALRGKGVVLARSLEHGELMATILLRRYSVYNNLKIS